MSFGGDKRDQTVDLLNATSVVGGQLVKTVKNGSNGQFWQVKIPYLIS